ncbi:MAG: glycosyltransferase [Candidatus Omnitrophota bacterium]
MDKRFVSIIVPVHNEEAHIADCINSILRVDYPKENYEVLVVDNGSTDRSAQIAKGFPVRLLEESRKGQAYARNLGAEHAKGEILAFLDADTVVDRGWLSHLVSNFSNSRVGAAGGASYPLKETVISQYLNWSLFERYPAFTKKHFRNGALPTSNLAIRKILFDDIKGFQMEGFEDRDPGDKDICYRILKSGFKIIYDPGAKIQHKHVFTFKALAKKWWRSSSSRVALSVRYPTRPDSVILRAYLPILYLIACLILAMLKQSFILVMFIIPPLGAIMLSAISAFRENRNLVLSFIIKPVLDVLSLLVISLAFFYYKHIRSVKVKP